MKIAVYLGDAPTKTHCCNTETGDKCHRMQASVYNNYVCMVFGQTLKFDSDVHAYKRLSTCKSLELETYTFRED